jgi:hypothetical protein
MESEREGPSPSKQQKLNATANAFGAPIRPRHLVPTQQGVGTLALNDLTPCRMAFYFVSTLCRSWESSSSHHEQNLCLIQAHFMLEIRISFRLISYWKRLIVTIQQYITYNSLYTIRLQSFFKPQDNSWFGNLMLLLQLSYVLFQFLQSLLERSETL